ncbi:MAG: hypothetical protein ABJF23_09520 [Bryobacteraceae bacterium]
MEKSLALPTIFTLHPGEELIQSYLTGTIRRADKDVVEVHLLLCDCCRRLCAETEEQVKAVRIKKQLPS